MKFATLLAFSFAVACASAVRAQNVVFAKLQDQVYPVCAVDNILPKVRQNGKVVSAYHGQFFLQSVPFFHDGFVQIDQFEVISHHIESNGSEMNRDLIMRGVMTATRLLENCYLVVEINESASAQKGIVLVELPRLEASTPQSFHVRLPLAESLGESHYRLHIFSGLSEIRHSRMMSELSFAVDKRTASYFLAQTEKSAAKPIFMIQPEFPAKLAGDSAGGSAKIACRIGTEGDVIEAEVAEASQPEYGQAALTAVKQWLFTPATRNHQFVVSKVIIPINFRPPPKTAASGS